MEVNEVNDEADLAVVKARIIIAITIVIAVSLTVAIGYNEMLKLTGKKPFWNVKEVRTVAIGLRIALLLAALTAVYFCIVAISILEESEAPENDVTAAYLNLYASIIGTVVAILALIAILTSTLEEEELIDTATVI